MTLTTVPNGLDASKLGQTDELVAAVAAGELGAVEADKILQAIVDQPPQHSQLLQQLMYVACGGGCALLFYGGGFLDMAVGGVLGGVVGLLCLLATRIDIGSALDFVCCFTVAIIARSLVTYVWPGEMCFFASALGACVWLFPGLSITTAVIELAGGAPISGTSRMFKALVTALIQGFGLALGSRAGTLGAKLGSYGCTSTAARPWFVQVPAFFVVYGSFAILTNAVSTRATRPRARAVCCEVCDRMCLAASCRADRIIVCSQPPVPCSPAQRKEQLVPMLVTNAAAYLASMWGPDYVGDSAATVVAAMAVGLSALLVRKVQGRSRSADYVPVISGILFLVPGSMGVRGAAALIDNDYVSGMQFGVGMLLTALSITIGLAVASAIVEATTRTAGLGKRQHFRWFMTPVVKLANFAVDPIVSAKRMHDARKRHSVAGATAHDAAHDPHGPAHSPASGAAYGGAGSGAGSGTHHASAV